MISRAYAKSLVWACALGLCCSACDESYGPNPNDPTDGNAGGTSGHSVGGSSGIKQPGGGLGGGPVVAGIGGFAGTGAAGGSSCSLCPCDSMCNSSCVDCGMGCFCQDMQSVPLPWTPPFESVGKDGWKDSDTPLCSGLTLDAGMWGLDVWSDARGVFVVTSGNSPRLMGTTDDPDEDAGVASGIASQPDLNSRMRTQIWFNDGSGWVMRAEKPDLASMYRLASIPDGPLVLSDPSNPGLMGFQPTMCALGLVQGATIKCFDLEPVQSTFAVSAKQAYALTSGVRVLAYDGTVWHSNIEALPYPATALWADRDRVLAVGKAGTALWLQGGIWTQDDPGTLESFVSVWGQAHDDLWAGTSSGGIFHYDGSTWSEKGRLGGVVCDAVQPVVDIWGADDQVYFATPTQFARWDKKAGEVESLSNWSCGPTAANRVITGIAGNGPKSVFISLMDFERGGVDSCGVAFLLNYDGKEFHRM